MVGEIVACGWWFCYGKKNQNTSLAVAILPGWGAALLRPYGHQSIAREKFALA